MRQSPFSMQAMRSITPMVLAAHIFCGLMLLQTPGLSEARELMVKEDQRSIHVEVLGEGLPVVLIPSLGRGAQDFDDLKMRLVDAGYQVILPQPRGIGQSSGLTVGLAARPRSGCVRGQQGRDQQPCYRGRPCFW